MKARIAQIQPGFPRSAHRPVLRPLELIEQAGGHPAHALLEEIVLVTLAHVVFLMHLRSILIVTIPLPLAVLRRSSGCITRASPPTS